MSRTEGNRRKNEQIIVPGDCGSKKKQANAFPIRGVLTLSDRSEVNESVKSPTPHSDPDFIP